MQDHSLLLNQSRIHLSRSLNTPQSYNSSNHNLTAVLKGHLGCVNTLNWSRDGKLLLSGSDDHSLIINKYSPGNLSDKQHFTIVNRFQTAHSNNIFDAKFTPGDDDKIVSVAGDGRVCILDDWSKRGWDALNTRTLVASQTHDARRLEFVDRNIFFVACGDGNIVQFDIRDTKPVNGFKIDLTDEQVSVHSISSCPSAPHLLAVAGSDPFIRIYDIRNSLNLCTCNLWSPPLKPNKKTNFCTGVKFSRFGYTLAANYIKDGPYLIDPIYQDKDESASKFLQTNHVVKSFGLQRELELWCRAQNSYRSGQFDEAERHLRILITQHRNLQNDVSWVVILANEVFNRVLCLGQLTASSSITSTIKEDLILVISVLDLWSARYLLVMYTLSLGLIEHGGLLCETFLKSAAESSSEWTTKLEHIRSIAAVCELDPAQIPKLIPKDFKQACAEVPYTDITSLPVTQRLMNGFNGYLAYYPNVVHEQTYKGITFVGDSDQYIGVGSDGGYAFLFKCPDGKDSSPVDLPVWAAKSDASVVNVVEGHPFLPCIATSGIDSTIKIWEPECLNPETVYQEQSSNIYKAFKTEEIPDLMANLPRLQGINRLDFQLNPFPFNASDLVIYF